MAYISMTAGLAKGRGERAGTARLRRGAAAARRAVAAQYFLYLAKGEGAGAGAGECWGECWGEC